jgi:CheY-like chemotaxis protein
MSIRTKGLVLVVDDDLFIQEYIAEIIQNDGYRVVTADNGEDAINIIYDRRRSSYPIQFVITDIIMPIMTGLELIDRLHGDGVFLPTIVISSLMDRDIRSKLKGKGITNALEKPVKEPDLLAHVRALSDKHREINA